MYLHEIAEKYIGQQEVGNNEKWKDATFTDKMRKVGHLSGHSWCVYFTELCAKEWKPEKFKEYDKLFTPNAVQTLRNFEKAGYTIHKLPKLNTICIWQKYKNGEPEYIQDGKTKWYLGHAGIPCKIENSWIFDAIEGNTDAEGSREGQEVAYKQNRKCLAEVENGLKVIGFIEI